MFAIASGISLGGAVWFLCELLSANFYYFALDSHRIYRRRGPGRLVSLPLSDLGELSIRLGTLYVHQRSTKRQIPLIKNAYSPEDVGELARRINLWRSSPPAERATNLFHLNILETTEVLLFGNRQIAWSLSILCFYPFLILLSLRFHLLSVPFVVFLWAPCTMVVLLGLLGGIVRRFRAKAKRPEGTICQLPVLQKASMKLPKASLLLVLAACLCFGCKESIPPKPARTSAVPHSERAALDASELGPKIRQLIQDLAQVKDPNYGLSPTMSGSGFAPVPRAGHMFSGILMNHGFKDDSSFLQLVEIGPPALPYLLESLTDKTPTKYTIDYSNASFGGMWYGERPAIRWVADEARRVRRMAEEKVADKEIAERISAPAEFIALAKFDKLPHFLPQSQGEFNPKNPKEQRLLAKARKELPRVRDERRENPFGSSLSTYTITVGDICYVIIGQITNRTYQAAQYQPTACTYIISPVHDARLAADVRAVWTSDEPTEMVFQSLRADLDSPRQDVDDALVRLGYYFPNRSESLLLEYVAKLEAVKKEPENSHYQNLGIIRALLGGTNPKVRGRLFELMKSTQDPYYFIWLQEGFGAEHDALVLKRAKDFINAITGDTSDGPGDSLLKMMGERFPEEALPILKEFVASPSLARRHAVINALWNSPLAGELLPPLLEDQRKIDFPLVRIRVCDRAAQAISNNNENLKFDDESPQGTRDQQIEKFKAELGKEERKRP
jgi:hypothetical protein